MNNDKPETLVELIHSSRPYPLVRRIGTAVSGIICVSLPLVLIVVVVAYVSTGGGFVLSDDAGVGGSVLVYAGVASIAGIFGYAGVRLLRAAIRRTDGADLR